MRFDDALTKIALSRRSQRRVRIVNVNGGEAILDFSSEPGSTAVDGALSMNTWRGARPLSRSLGSFFEAILNTDRSENWAENWAESWALSVSACLDSVRSAQRISDELRRLQRARLEDLRESGIELDNQSHRNLIVDLLLPEYAAQDRRRPAITIEEQYAFTRHVCETQGMRCK